MQLKEKKEKVENLAKNSYFKKKLFIYELYTKKNYGF